MSSMGLSDRAREPLLDLFALIVLAIFVAVLLERTWDVASTSYSEGIRSNTPLRLPLAWSQLPWFGGIALFAVALLLAILRTLSEPPARRLCRSRRDIRCNHAGRRNRE